jgi:hypothetical protein
MKSNKLFFLFPVILLIFACSGGGGGGNRSLVSITVTPAAPSMAMATTQQFRARGRYSDNSTQDLTTALTWTSSNTRVAKIIATTGLATSLASGITTIRATSGSISGTAALTVLVPGGGSGASNVLSITVNGSLCSDRPFRYPNKPCVSVTVCNPGTSTCQTITDILLDTGSTGLRIFRQALNDDIVPPVSGGLAECIQFADGSADWGPVQSADVRLAGEDPVTVPIHVIDADFGVVPDECGIPEAGPDDAGFNGILGVGLFAEDCGSGCVSATGNGMYYTCSGSDCSGAAVALADQVQNPVAHLPQDNNGVLVQLPVVPLGGVPSVDGQLVLGIGTRDNNTPTTEVAYPADPYGEFITVFNGAPLDSFIDSGSNGLFFTSALSICHTWWYCPPATTPLSARTEGFSGTPVGVVSFRIGNATTLFSSPNNVFVELGGTGSGFDWGLPFFYGRNVFVGIEGMSSPLGISGRYWAY